jgi:tellurite resistance protein TerC
MDRAEIIYWPDRGVVRSVCVMKLLDAGSAGLWLAFALTVTSVLVLDLGVLQRDRRAPTPVEAIAWSVLWIVLAALFGLGVTTRLGAAAGAQYFTAYVVEKSLSVDNLFVLMLVFGQFGIPASGQRRVLMAGVVGAIVLRTGMLLLGTAAVARFHALTCAMGVLLVATAVKLLARHGAEAGREKAPEPGFAVRLARRLLPAASPMLLALVAVESADLVFALDSVPAVLGVTTSPFIAVTSNVFAILGLRSLYFVVAAALSRLRHLQTGLALVILFVGLRMALSFVIDVPTAATLAVITAILGVAVFASLRSSPIAHEEES